tara:strand:- start:3275 stop:3532 length:258 start_codon:yes stop_codon:yes gene_type:complete
METKTDPINLIDWWKAINYLPIGSKLISLIKSRRISEEDSKLVGVTDQDIYFAKKRVYMKKEIYTTHIIEETIKDIRNYEYVTVL